MWPSDAKSSLLVASFDTAEACPSAGVGDFEISGLKFCDGPSPVETVTVVVLSSYVKTPEALKESSNALIPAGSYQPMFQLAGHICHIGIHLNISKVHNLRQICVLVRSGRVLAGMVKKHF